MNEMKSVNILAEREIGKKVRKRSPGGGFGVWHHLKSQGPLAPLPRFSHMIYTDLRGHEIWIKIGKNLPIGSTKCSLEICKITDLQKNVFGPSSRRSRME